MDSENLKTSQDFTSNKIRKSLATKEKMHIPYIERACLARLSAFSKNVNKGN
jgi:hypothetical protein